MKKFLALLIAMIIGMFSAIPATSADVNPVDTTKETKIVEWAIGYSKRCHGYYGKIVKPQRNYKFVKRLALAPLMLFIGTAAAEPAMKKPEKQDQVLQPKPSGVWAKRLIKSAKDSAKWLDHLLHLRELKDKTTARKVDMVTNDVEECRKAYIEWRKSLAPRYFFTTDDRAYELMRRKLENMRASELLGHPAAKAAALFSSGLMAATKIIHADIDEIVELGGKKIFDKMQILNDCISTIEDEADDLKDEINYLWTLSGQAPQVLDVIHEKEPRLNELKAELKEVYAERKVLRTALKELRDGADDAVKALIDARAGVVAKKLSQPKQKPGRHVKMVAKPNVKGYKLMAFESSSFMPASVSKILNDLDDAAYKYVEGVNENANGNISDDELKARRTDVRRIFRTLYTEVKTFEESNTPFEADEKNARVNNARQSQLSDIIGVPYGKLTDMIVNIDHNMAHLIAPRVATALSDDPKEAEKNIDGIETMLMNVLTKNGLNIKFRNQDGKVRKEHYNFWNANNSALKVGKCYVLSDFAYVTAKIVAQIGMSDEEYWRIATNGPDMLKHWSYATTPGSPLTYKDQPLTTDDVLVVNSVNINRTFNNVLEYVSDEKKKEWKKIVRHHAKIPRTAYDGQLFFLVPIPSQQLRGGMAFKGYGVNCAWYDENGNVVTMIDEIARREGLVIPEYIKDIDGNMRRWRDYKVIATRDSFKRAGSIRYDVYCDRMRRIAEKIPEANMLYTARIADATEEGRRRLTRQSTQQFLFGTDEQIKSLMAKSVNNINKLKTYAGIVRKFAGLDKPEEQRNAFEHLIEVAPEILSHEMTKRYIKDKFDREVAEKAVRPDVDGIYPYIAEDPVAFFKIVFFGMNPDQVGLGYLGKNQVNIPDAEEGKEMYLVRYPNNYLCGMVAKNHNDSIYDCVGNTMILSLDEYYLIRADGDVDGDEMCAIFNLEVIEMMKKTIELIKPQLIVFPHDKLETKVLATAEERAYALAKAMVIANKFGPAVGQNSNLATKFMHRAGMAQMQVERAMMNKDREEAKRAANEMRCWLDNAIIAHIAAIIAIDLAKTGEMPAWLQKKLEDIKKYAGKKMPWNQRFCKDSKITPWFHEGWDKITRKQEDSPADRIANYLVKTVDAYNYKVPTGNNFVKEQILCSKEGLYTQGSKGRLTTNVLDSLDKRNYMSANKDGIDERSLITKFHSENEKDKVGFTDLIVFLWRNQASLVYKLQKNREDENKLDNTDMINDYYRTVHDILIRFGSYCGNESFAQLSPENQAKSNVWKAVEMAFELDNKAGGHPTIIKDENGKETKVFDEEQMSSKASFCMFVLKVFSPDLYDMVCEKRHIVHRWIRKNSEDNENADMQNDSLWFSACDDDIDAA